MRLTVVGAREAAATIRPLGWAGEVGRAVHSRRHQQAPVGHLGNLALCPALRQKLAHGPARPLIIREENN